MNNDTNKKEINSEEQPQTKKPFIIRLFALILLIGFVILLICYIYMLITGRDYGYFGLIAFQCFGVSLSGFLSYYSAKRLTGKREIALLTWFCFLILVILSPWVVVPYTDVVGLIFLSTALFLYSTQKLPPLLGIILAVGYYIKPTVIIPAIAIVICSLTKIHEIIKSDKKLKLYIILTLSGFILGFGIVKISTLSLNITLDKEKELAVPHFFMQGLNEETNGVYSSEDVLFSESFTTLNTRNAHNMEESLKRLNNMGIGRTIKHVGKKILVSFNDGTFAWTQEGDFIFYLPEDKTGRIQDFYRNLFYPTGSYYNIYLFYTQCIWMAVLCFLTIGAFLYKPEANKFSISVMKLALIGFALFEILFEPRARHILICLPVLLILASAGFYSLPLFKQNPDSDR
jgi:hypothetical protein